MRPPITTRMLRRPDDLIKAMLGPAVWTKKKARLAVVILAMVWFGMDVVQ